MKTIRLTLNIVAALILFGWASSSQPVLSQTPAAPAAPVEEVRQPFPISRSVWLRLTGQDEPIESLGPEDLKKRPFAYWHVWANKPLPVVRAILLLLFTSICAQSLIPARLSVAQNCCRSRFWPSLGRGVLGVIITLVPVRPLFMSELGSPLAMLLVGVLQLGLLVGFAVTAHLVGGSLIDRTFLGQKPWMAQKPVRARLAKTVLGVLILGCLLFIPGVGRLPRIGVRLIMFTAMLGFGGLLKTKLGSQSVE